MPRALGPYELLSPLGRGGMGEVWRARHTGLDRVVAVKQIVPGALRSDPTAVERFMREARAAAGLHSPHTIRIHDLGVAEDGSFFQVMELLEGYDLQLLVERTGPVPAERIVALLRQACDALAAAHAQGLTHRDIKPSNLFLSRAGTQVDHLTVLDFGLARREAANDVLLTQAGVVPGSPAYLAPELLRGEVARDRSDIYALGCVAWWLSTGRMVFEARSALELVVAHLERAPGPLPGVPDALADLLRVCLSKDPAARPTARELSRRLATLNLPAWTEARAEDWWEANPPPATEATAAPPESAGAQTDTRANPGPTNPAALKAARERAYLDLRRHFEQSRIDLGELERRMGRAGSATTEAAVQSVLDGLEPPQLPVPAPPPVPEAAPAVVSDAPIVALFGSTTRTGGWTPAPLTRVVSICGGVELDLREVMLRGDTEFRCVAALGGVRIVVPPDLRVQVEGVGILGGFDSDASSGGQGPLLRISGMALLGGVNVEVKARPSATPIADAVARGAAALQQVADGIGTGLQRARRRE